MSPISGQFRTFTQMYVGVVFSPRLIKSKCRCKSINYSGIFLCAGIFTGIIYCFSLYYYSTLSPAKTPINNN